MPEVVEQASDLFMKEWRTFTLVILAGVGTWYGIKIDMFDAGLWEHWMEVGVWSYVTRTVGKAAVGAWKSSKLNGKG